MNCFCVSDKKNPHSWCVGWWRRSEKPRLDLIDHKLYASHVDTLVSYFYITIPIYSDLYPSLETSQGRVEGKIRLMDIGAVRTVKEKKIVFMKTPN